MQHLNKSLCLCNGPFVKQLTTINQPFDWFGVFDQNFFLY